VHPYGRVRFSVTCARIDMALRDRRLTKHRIALPCGCDHIAMSGHARDFFG
jgi:hypothetical protein